MAITYLIKDSNDLVSCCECELAYNTYPAQLDCPWCGCGWLFACIECRKAFTFARGVKLETTWHGMGRWDFTNKWRRPPEDHELEKWVSVMRSLHEHVEVGKRYVYLDGLFIPTDCGRVQCGGLHKRHDLASIPHLAALKDRSILDSLLGNVDYWKSNAFAELEE